MRAAFLVGILAAALGCGPSDAALFVELQTDYVLHEEFTSVVTRLHDGPSAPRDDALTPGLWTDQGRRVARFHGLAPGRYTLEIRIEPDAMATPTRAQWIEVNVQRGVNSIRVWLTRDCAATGCTETCLNGTCYERDNNPMLADWSGTMPCIAPTDCPTIPSAECAVAVCDQGICLQLPVEEACDDATEWCHPDTGCTPRSSPVGDAGAPLCVDDTACENDCGSGTTVCTSGRATCDLDTIDVDAVCDDLQTSGRCDTSGTCRSILGFRDRPVGGIHHMCAVNGDLEIYCWGQSDDQVLGADGGDALLAQPTDWSLNVVGSDYSLAAGYAHTCAILNNGAIACWGSNSHGQVSGNPAAPEDSTKTPVTVPGVGTVSSLAAGYRHTCLTESGSVHCFGDNSVGQLGDGSIDPHIGLSTPDISFSSGIDQVYVGGSHNCVVDEGNVYCWGSNVDHQISQSIEDNIVMTPTLVPGISNVISLATGGAHTCAIADPGNGYRVYCWGNNIFKQAGAESPGPVGTPTLIESQPYGPMTVHAGEHHTCVRHASGLSCFGMYGTLGGAHSEDEWEPVAVEPNATVNDVMITWRGGCAEFTGDGIKCWGFPTANGGEDGLLPGSTILPVHVLFSEQ